MTYPNLVAAPTGTSDALASFLKNQAALQRQYNQVGVDTQFKRGALANNRTTYLQQLGQRFNDQTRNQQMDFAARGLGRSGLRNEGNALLTRNQLAQRGQFEMDYNNQLQALNQGALNARLTLKDRMASAQDAYKQLLSQQATSLRLAGYSAL